MEVIPVGTLSHPIIQKRDDGGGVIGEGLEFVKGRQGTMGIVIPQATIQPAVKDGLIGAIAVLLREPPIEAIHIGMVLQLGDKVTNEGQLSFWSVWPGGERVPVKACRRFPLIIIGRLNNLHRLLWIVLCQQFECR